MNMLEIISGYKTYAAAACFLFIGIFQAGQGDGDKAAQSIVSALGLAGVRHSISKVQ